ncbi:kinesin-like protein KIF22 isoform X1 [Polypterus senegalus]|uniref:kinesin-like protein KIF22 isoform X1 n=1 Tax=Polypterus senegalus TaxID=55291 RepID=UPI00196380AC|nr:kinesin-like protein KIF22 isoform X1 [Polypterus senegalus]
MVTTLDFIKETLDRLKKEDLEQFRLKLSDPTLEDGTTIPAGIVQKCKNTGSLAEKLINYFTAAKAPSVVIATLRRCNQNELALQMEKNLGKPVTERKKQTKKRMADSKKGSEKIMTIKKLLEKPSGNQTTPLKLRVLSMSRTSNYKNKSDRQMQMKFLTLSDKSEKITGKLYDMSKTSVIKVGQCVCLQDYIYDADNRHVVITSKTQVKKAREFYTIGMEKTQLFKKEKGNKKEKLKMTNQGKEQTKQNQVNSASFQAPDALSELLRILNYGSKKQLKMLKHIGEKKVQLIIDWRINNTFKQVEDLGKIDGISRNTVATLKEHFLKEHNSQGPSTSKCC